MSHPAKKVFFGSFVALCLLGSSWGATVSFTNSATSTNAQWVNLSLGKFNSNLGTLTAVAVTIHFATASGGVQLVNPSDDPTTLNVITTQAQFTNGSLLPAPPTIRTLSATNTMTPSGFPTTIDGGDSATYNISNGPVTNNFNFTTNIIGQSFWDAYSSVGGVGSNVFQFRLRLNPNTTGPNLDANPVNLSGTAQMSVTYTYTSAEPIPEPSTVAAGAFLTVLAAASYWRRRRSAR